MSSKATFAAEEAVQLAVVERSGFIESRHVGSAVVLGADGEVIRSLGATSAPIFPRSALKPFQALGVLGSGVELTGTSAVLATASHTGTPEHVAVVRQLLGRASLTEDALQCPADSPADGTARDALIRSRTAASPIFMNCSGKHAAMLLACVQNEWDTQSYLEPDHPVQQRIRDIVERLTAEKISATGVDGCGAPVHAVTLTGLARGIQKITTAQESSPFALFRNAARLTAAVLANGWAIAGPGRPDTVVIEELGAFSKSGAEGVKVITAPGGITVAVKILDGDGRAASIVGLRLLVEAGALDEEKVAALDLRTSVTGGGRPVGQIRAEFPS